MKAIHYEKPFRVSVREIPIPKTEHPDDVIIKVTTAGIYYSVEIQISFADDREQQSAVQICTCTRAGRRRRVVSFSVSN